jgi:hypothetical protein
VIAPTEIILGLAKKGALFDWDQAGLVWGKNVFFVDKVQDDLFTQATRDLLASDIVNA